MSRVFITGSSDGLGLMAARLLLEEGHTVVAHARNAQRAEHIRRELPGAAAVLIGDFASLEETRSLAAEANQLGSFDAVIHNAAIGYKERSRKLTTDGLPVVFQTNTLAPFMLTALMLKPRRLVYVSSELHRKGERTLEDLTWEHRHWSGSGAYSDTKFHDVLLAFAFARLWPRVLSNAMEPGWVPTKMGGPRASGDLDQGHRTQAWLAVSNDPAALVSGEYFYHLQPRKPAIATRDTALQDKLLTACVRLSGVALPEAADPEPAPINGEPARV